MIKEFLNRIKYGYPIGEGFRKNLVTRDQVRIWYKEAKCFDVFFETLIDESIVVHSESPPQFYNDSNEVLSREIWTTGIKQLMASFRKQGLKVTTSSELK